MKLCGVVLIMEGLFDYTPPQSIHLSVSFSRRGKDREIDSEGRVYGKAL